MKQYIEFNDLDVNEVIDFEFVHEKGRESVNHTLNNTTATPEKDKPKYVRKTIYINRDYLDVLEFFNRKDSSVAICKLIREALKREKGEVTEVEMSEMMRMIKEIHSLTIK